MVGALLDSHLVTVCSGSNSCNNAFRFSSLRLRTGAVGCGSSGVSSFRNGLIQNVSHNTPNIRVCLSY